jgi:hypothetical protein
MKRKKAQAWGFDLMVALVIFLGGILFFYFYAFNYQNDSEELFQVMHREADTIADSLLSEGSPPDWTSSNVIRIGLLTDERIDENKLSEFYAMDYNVTKLLFRIKDEYYIYFEEPMNIVGGFSVVGIGMNSSSAANIVNVERIVVYNNSIKTMHVNVWN